MKFFGGRLKGAGESKVEKSVESDKASNGETSFTLVGKV